MVSNNEELSGNIFRTFTTGNFWKFTFLKSKLFKDLKSNFLESIILFDEYKELKIGIFILVSWTTILVNPFLNFTIACT